MLSAGSPNAQGSRGAVWPWARACEKSKPIWAQRTYSSGLGGSASVGTPKNPPMSKLANAAPDRIQLSAPRRLAAISLNVDAGSPPQCTGLRCDPAYPERPQINP